jgi:hypothetical protein
MTVPDTSDLAHIFWLGGSPCCGKSTIADRIAARAGMLVYRCDDAFYDHVKLVTPDTQPAFNKIASYDADGLWLRPVEQQIAEEIELYREEFRMILEDLRALPTDRPIIAEGAALMPELLAPLGIPHYKMMWVVPTGAFQRSHYEQRDWRHDAPWMRSSGSSAPITDSPKFDFLTWFDYCYTILTYWKQLTNTGSLPYAHNPSLAPRRASVEPGRHLGHHRPRR